MRCLCLLHVWTTSCIFKDARVKKLLSQLLHLKGFTSVWILQWIPSCLFPVKPQPHTSHLYKFSPVWILWWIPSFDFRIQPWPHTSHFYGFSPVWRIWWSIQLSLRVKAFPHTSHLYGFSPVWVLWWTARQHLELNILHTNYIYMVSYLIELPNVYLMMTVQKKVCHSCYTCKISLQYEFSDDF